MKVMYFSNWSLIGTFQPYVNMYNIHTQVLKPEQPHIPSQLLCSLDGKLF